MPCQRAGDETLDSQAGVVHSAGLKGTSAHGRKVREEALSHFRRFIFYTGVYALMLWLFLSSLPSLLPPSLPSFLPSFPSLPGSKMHFQTLCDTSI